MVMSDDEQGYAPASYLEPVEEAASHRDVHPEDQTNQGWEKGVGLEKERVCRGWNSETLYPQRE